MALHAHCKIQYNTAFVLVFHETGIAEDIVNADFSTGDLGSPSLFGNNHLVITGAQGTTLNTNESGGSNSLGVTSETGISVGEWVAIELDVAGAFGTHFWTKVTATSANQVDILDALPSAASIGQQVVSVSQLDTTTAFTVTEDFKDIKAKGIFSKTQNFRQGYYTFNDVAFNATEQLMTEVNTILSSAKAVTKYDIPDANGHTFVFADENEANLFADGLAEFNELLQTGQDTLLDSVRDAINSQAAMDAIVDSRTEPVPTFSGTAKPVVRFDDSTKQEINLTAENATAITSIQWFDEFAALQNSIFTDYNVDKFCIDALNYRLELKGESINGVEIYAANASGIVTIQTDGPDTVQLFHWRTLGTNGDFIDVFLGSRNPEGLVLSDGGSIYFRAGTTTADVFLKKTDGVNIGWQSIKGNVVGPSSAVDNRIATFDLTTGEIIQDGGATLLTTGGTSTLDSNTNNLVLRSDGGSTTIFADGSIAITADSAGMTFTSAGTVTYNFSSNTIDTNCGVYDLDANGAISLSTSAGDVTLEPGSANNVVLNTTGFIDINAGVGTGKVLDMFSDGIAAANSDWYLTNASPEGVITGNGGDVAIVDNGTSSDFLFKTTDASNTGWASVLNNSVEEFTADATIIAESDHVRIDASVAIRTATLPLASVVRQGKIMSFKLADISSTFYGDLALPGSDTINGSTVNRRMGALNDTFTIMRVGSASWDIINTDRSAIAEMSHTGGSTAQGSVGSTPLVVTAFNNNIVSTNGVVAADQANNEFDVTHVEGTIDTYLVGASMSLEFDNNVDALLEVFVNGVATGITAQFNGTGAGDAHNIALNGSFTVATAGHDVDIRISAPGGGSNTATYISAHATIVRSR